MSVEQWRRLAEISTARWGRALGVIVPVPVVLGVIQRESSGDPRAIGDQGQSRGLMQVKAATARTLGLEDPRQLHVPAIGIDYGVRYLAQQLARYGGRVPAALAAYNAGSARFNEREQFVNQAYVDQVLRFAQGFARGAAAAAPWLLVAGVLATMLIMVSGSRRRRRLVAA